MAKNTMAGVCDSTGKPRVKDRAHRHPVEFTYRRTHAPDDDQAYCPACGALVWAVFADEPSTVRHHR